MKKMFLAQAYITTAFAVFASGLQAQGISEKIPLGK